MKITNKNKLEEFHAFINSINDSDKVAVIYDTDMDGISSGVVTVKALEKLGKIVHFQRSRTPGTRTLTQDLLDVFEKEHITKILFLDLPVEGYANANEINKYDVMVIDHHPLIQEHNKNFTIIKSFDLQTETQGHKYCTAHMSYDLFSSMTNIEDIDWIAATGIIGDITYQTQKKFVDSILNKYDFTIKDNPFDTEIGEVVQYVTYATCIGTQEEMNNIFDALYNATTPQKTIEGLKHLTPVKEEFEKLIQNYDSNKEIISDELIIYEFEAQYYINSPVSTTISQIKDKHKTIITAHFKDDIVSISARRQDGKHHMGDMLRECTQDLPEANGGGHAPAAGAKVQKKDYQTFKERAIAWIEKQTTHR